eukprot:m.286325 g.286325  ORF g.286325 m.286325 type:complete len:206 (+) comp16350_c0_seq7:102-719(+)
MTGLSHVPIEILALILSKTNLNDKNVLLTFVQVCKKWTNVLGLISRNKEMVLPIGEVSFLLYKQDKLCELRYMCETLQVHQSRTPHHSYTFRVACGTGHLWFAQWLTATFNLTAEDAKSRNNYALYCSCSNGHLQVAQWLTTTFNLSAKDAKADDYYVLRRSCENGHLHVVQWLVTTFNLRLTRNTLQVLYENFTTTSQYEIAYN